MCKYVNVINVLIMYVNSTEEGPQYAVHIRLM